MRDKDGTVEAVERNNGSQLGCLLLGDFQQGPQTVQLPQLEGYGGVVPCDYQTQAQDAGKLLQCKRQPITQNYVGYRTIFLKSFRNPGVHGKLEREAFAPPGLATARGLEESHSFSLSLVCRHHL